MADSNRVYVRFERFSAPVGESVYRLLFIHAVRPDRFLASAHMLVSSVFGEHFLLQAETVLDLQNVVEHEVSWKFFARFERLADELLFFFFL